MTEKKYQEVELRFKLSNIKEVLIILEELAAEKVIDQEYQCDTYFVPYHRDFFEEEIISEWLRLRKTNFKEQINYKRWLPIGAKIQTHCEEYETDVTDGYALRKILEYMDFREIIKVEKKRNCWKYGDVLICIDEVTELGTFIELEYIKHIEEKKVEEICKDMEKMLHDILHAIVEPRDRRGYPYQMMSLKGVLNSSNREERKNDK